MRPDLAAASAVLLCALSSAAQPRPPLRVVVDEHLSAMSMRDGSGVPGASPSTAGARGSG